MKRRPPSTASYAVPLFALCALSALGSACDLPPSFGPEYEDSSRNFIAEPPLAMPVNFNDQGGTVALDARATWDWAWRGRTGNTYEYMTFASDGATGPSSSDAWRLETISLGTHRTATTTDGWTAMGGATLSAAGTLHGTAIQASFSKSSESIQIDSNFFDDTDALPHSYALTMYASGTSSLRYLDSASASYATEFLQPLSWTDGKPNAVSFYAGPSGSLRRLLFTKADASTLYLDNISALRTDVDVKLWALCIRLGIQDTSPSLVPGLYSFSVWVKKPAGYDFSTDTGREDNTNYAARYISLSMIQFIGGSTQSTSRVWNISDTSVVADPSAWTKLELRLSPSAPFSFRENATGQVLELRIACTGTQGVELEPGSILIAQPSLNFFKDGY